MIPENERAWLENTQGLVEVVEGEHLASLAAQVPANQAIVEIGSHTGLSACWMAAGSRQGNRAHIFCVDPWPEPRPPSPHYNDDPWELGAEGVLERFRSNVAGTTQWTKNPDYGDLITPLRISSLQLAPHWLKPIGLLFIDAMHGYGDVLADCQAWMNHVAQGGWLCFHDYFDDIERTHPSQVADAIADGIYPELWDGVEVVWNIWTGRRV